MPPAVSAARGFLYVPLCQHGTTLLCSVVGAGIRAVASRRRSMTSPQEVPTQPKIAPSGWDVMELCGHDPQ